jgi:hypothetical protein
MRESIMKQMIGVLATRDVESLRRGHVFRLKRRNVIVSLIILLINVTVFSIASEVVAQKTQKKMIDIVFGLQETPKTTGKEAWIIDSEEVPLIDTSDRVMGRLFFQAPITVLEETPKGSRIRVFGWLEIVFPKEAKVEEGNKVKTPWRGSDILDKLDRSSMRRIGEAIENTQFYYLRRILEKDSHYYQVVLEGYIPSICITTDFNKTTIPGTVSGRVTRKGKPAVGLEVALFNWRSNPAVTNDDGQFLLKQIPPGRHAVCWRNSRSSTWSYFMMGGSGSGMLKPGGHLDLGQIDIGD